MLGVSPLLAAVMLIAVTVGVGTLTSGFISTTFQSSQITTGNKTAASVECVNAEIVVDDVYSKVGDNGTTVAVLRNSGFADDLTIASAQLYDRLGNNFSASNMPITDFDKGKIGSLTFQLPNLSGTASDSSVYNTNGTLGAPSYKDSSEPKWTLDGKRGPALNFDGVNDYVVIQNTTLFNLNNVTVSAWVKIDTGVVNQENITRIISKENNGGVNNGWRLVINRSAMVSFDVTNGTDTIPNYTTPTVALNVSAWYYLAGIVNGSEARFYINGTLQGNVSHSLTGNYFGQNNLTIGNIGTLSTNWFNGTIDEVAVWNRTLSGTEINASMNAGPLSVSNSNDLVGYWRFDEGKGVIVCSDFSKLIATTTCGGISATFDKLPKCS